MPAAAAIGALALLAAAAAALWVRGRVRTRALRRDLDEARRRLGAADDAREAFFDLVTHELRSPLSAVLGFQELLRDGAYGDLEDGAREAVDRIGRSARHLLNLIDGLVELSRLRGGSLQPRTEQVNLGVVLPAVADAFRGHLRDRGIQAGVAMPDALPTIRSDGERLTRALDLLITSAVRHPAGDSLSLDVETTDDGVALHVHETDLDLHTEADDPALRLGLRLAVAAGLAHVLGGELLLDPPDGPIVRRISFRIRDLEPTDRRTPATL